MLKSALLRPLACAKEKPASLAPAQVLGAGEAKPSPAWFFVALAHRFRLSVGLAPWPAFLVGKHNGPRFRARAVSVGSPRLPGRPHGGLTNCNGSTLP